jgi:pectinesterase
VFLDCKLTGDNIPWAPPGSQPTSIPADKAPRAVLGRPWRPYAAVAYVRCEMGGHLSRWGWGNWNKPENEKTARYREYKNTGPGADRSQRAPWTRELTDEEATKYTVENILNGDDNWNPTHD